MDSSSGTWGKIPGIAEIDAEHQLQIGLVRAFEEAVWKGDRPGAQGILEQMVNLAEAHFLAEELLMRLHRYPRFDDHVQEHAHLLEELGSVKRAWAGVRFAPTLKLAEQLKRSLTSHLEGPDQALAAYLEREATSGDQAHIHI